MTENRIVPLRQEGAVDDPLTEILRAGAKRLISRAVEAEFDAFPAAHGDLALPDGRQRVVRHGHDPARIIQTGIGPVEVKKPKARDRGATAEGERLRCAPAQIPLWARRARNSKSLTQHGPHSFSPAIKRAEPERDVSVSADAVASIRAAIEAAGIEFTYGDRPGVRMSAKPATRGGLFAAVH